jgi:hypothetical protein
MGVLQKLMQYNLDNREDVKEFKIRFFHFVCLFTVHTTVYVNNHQLNREIATENLFVSPFILLGWTAA